MTESNKSASELIPTSIESTSLVALGRYVAKETGIYMSAREEPAFVLTSWPWRETSLIVSLFTKRRGRVTVVARGAKRPAGRFRGLLDPFVPLLVNFSGRTEVKNLTGAKWMGGLAPITGEGLLTGFYLNELVFRLTAAESPQPELFEAYTRTLACIARGDWTRSERAMREFEVDILHLCGWGQRLEEDADGFVGFVRDGEILNAESVNPQEGESVVRAEVVRAVLTRDFSDADVLKDSREVLRAIVEFYALGGRTLSSRRTVAKWRQFRQETVL